MLSPCDLVSPAYNLFAQLDCRRLFPCWNACKGQVRCHGATIRACTFINSCPTRFAGASVIIITDLRQSSTDLSTHSDTTNTRLAASSAVFFLLSPLLSSTIIGFHLKATWKPPILKYFCLAFAMHNSILGVDKNKTNQNHKSEQVLLLNTVFMPTADKILDWWATMCSKTWQIRLKQQQKQCFGDPPYKRNMSLDV